MQEYQLYDNLFDEDPRIYFSTAAGPAEDDVYGPPTPVLDVYGDGSPMLGAERAIRNNVYRAGTGSGGAVHTNFFHRGDVQALVIMVVGYLMVRAHLKD